MLRPRVMEKRGGKRGLVVSIWRALRLTVASIADDVCAFL